MERSAPHEESENRQPWHALPAEEVLERLRGSSNGLSPEEAEARLARVGPNRLKASPPTPRLKTLWHQFQSPLIAVLAIAALVTLLLAEYVDSAVIAAVLAINASIGYVQERRAERSVRALMGLVRVLARVIRAGRERQVDGADLVPGDVVLLESGSRVPADLFLLAAQELRVDESLLTGESTAVHKEPKVIAASAPLAERRNCLFTGSMVLAGRARGVVLETGTRTELGRIAQSLLEPSLLKSPLEQRMGRFGRLIGLAVTAAAGGTMALGLLLGHGLSEMFLVAVALAVAVVPEGLPVALTVALTVGVRRMASRNAILRTLSAVETLGSTSLIGSDKTGTLTQNRMTAVELCTFEGTRKIEPSADTPKEQSTSAPPLCPPDRAEEGALLAAVLANEADVRWEAGQLEVLGDPTETALYVLAAQLGLDPVAARAQLSILAEIPFESARAFAASLRSVGNQPMWFVKGAPEKVLTLCAPRADGPGEAWVLERAAAMAGRGLRVLALAFGPAERSGEGEPSGLVLAGLVGLLDPPRPGVAQAVRDCQRAGIRVLMITGDHARTAAAIASELGISADPRVITGRDLDALNEEELARAITETSVFARVTPEHKLRVVRAAQALGHVVAVTGDGVNDAPALKHADIGVAMGRSGTDVAREAADMVLVDDNFLSIHAAVEEGRVTFDNVRKVTYFLVSTGAATVVLIPTAIALGWPLPLLPAQLLWLNLVTNGLQDVALAFEPKEPGVLERPPRPRREPVVSRALWWRAGLVGMVMAAGVLTLFQLGLASGQGEVHARSVALTALVVAMAFHVGGARSEHRSTLRLSPFSNRFLLLSQILALGLHLAAMHLPWTQRILRIQPIGLADWLPIVVLGALVFATGELHKLWCQRSTPRAHSQVSL